MLNGDFLDFVQLLNTHDVAYMVVGGYALAFHGKPRFTGDLDIWIEVSTDNARKMTQVLHDFGMGSLGLTEDDFLSPGLITQIGHPPLRIDILNEIDGVAFSEARPNAMTVAIGDASVRVIGLSEFIRNKKASGRAQDLVDVAHLTKSGADQP